MNLPTIQVGRRPKSNTERQREFRDRNPGYYGRLHRERKAARIAYAAAKAGQAAQPIAIPLTLTLTLPTPAELVPLTPTTPAPSLRARPLE